jgi:hypothetical protein
MIRTFVRPASLCVAFSCVTLGQTLPPSKAQAPGAVTADAKCDCSVLPWTPNPPCAKQCAGLVIGGTTVVELKDTLHLTPAVVKAVEKVKAEGVTQQELDTFLRSPEGKAFTKAMEDKPVTAKAIVKKASKEKAEH